MFEVFDYISDESIMADLFAPWSKSFINDKNEKFEQGYKKFLGNLNNETESCSEDNSKRFRTSTRNCRQINYNLDSLKMRMDFITKREICQ